MPTHSSAAAAESAYSDSPWVIAHLVHTFGLQETLCCESPQITSLSENSACSQVSTKQPCGSNSYMMLRASSR
ncbi:hypothetical protein CSHISOI_09263 [Colletotrichum shisoi]|uniref:Uncharacterized protein n=1 Tax=Colletotrichum shisoi TaxID=2078593 RepID=A0A5Q4BGV4_9PEZI|nr:hypothetical protein CSHISOI_09263 [Colletotrichum shisoi]